MFEQGLNLLFSPEGAIRRIPFFLGILLSTALGYLLNVLFDLALTVSHADHLLLITYLLLITIVLIGFWMNTCLTLKRLSDLDVTRWLILIPILNAYAARFMPDSMPLLIANLAISVIFFLILLLWPSRV
jgi:uncharacterized membrane protein YhaH (DUF805 family)